MKSLKTLLILIVLSVSSNSYAADPNDITSIAQTIFTQLNNLAKFFDSMTAPFAVLGISVIVLRFMYAMVKKEIQGFEDILSFIADRGVRFVVAMMLFLPVSIPGVVDTEGYPTAMYLYKMGSEASFATADALARKLYYRRYLELPYYFEDDWKAKAEVLENRYNQDVKNSVTGEQIAFNRTERFTRSLVGLVSGGLLALVGVGYIPGVGDTYSLLMDGITAGASMFVNRVIDLIRDVFMNLSIIVTFYGATMIAIVKFFIYAPFFFFSVVLIFFDKMKDTLYQNVWKWVALMLYPVGIVVAFTASVEGYGIYRGVVEKYMELYTHTNSYCMRFTIGFATAGLFAGVVVQIFRTMHSFIQNMLGAGFSAGLSGAIK